MLPGVKLYVDISRLGTVPDDLKDIKKRWKDTTETTRNESTSYAPADMVPNWIPHGCVKFRMIWSKLKGGWIRCKRHWTRL